MHTLIEIDAGCAEERVVERHISKFGDDRRNGDAPETDDEISSLDHIAFACRIGQTPPFPNCASVFNPYLIIFKMCVIELSLTALRFQSQMVCTPEPRYDGWVILESWKILYFYIVP